MVPQLLPETIGLRSGSTRRAGHVDKGKGKVGETSYSNPVVGSSSRNPVRIDDPYTKPSNVHVAVPTVIREADAPPYFDDELNEGTLWCW